MMNRVTPDGSPKLALTDLEIELLDHFVKDSDKTAPRAKTLSHYLIKIARLIRDYFWPHARAALRQIGLTDRHKHVRKILRWIKTHGREQVSLMDVRREALGGSRDAEQTEALLDRMEMAGWLRRDTAKTGGRPRHRWSVNPKLFVAAGTAGSAGSALDIPAVPAVSAIRRGGRQA
jgi:hypothetical protein